MNYSREKARALTLYGNELEVSIPSCYFLPRFHCGVGHLKKNYRLLPDLKPSQNVPKHSLFKLCKFHEKVKGRFFTKDQNVLNNA